MTSCTEVRKIRDLAPGDHLCCFYETEEEHRASTTAFLRRGLEENDKVLYIVDANDAVLPVEYLGEDGVEAGPLLACGQLSILSADQTYLQTGRFDPERTVALLRAATDRALAQGYRALRVVCEMTWALRNASGCGRLIEFEYRLTSFVLRNPCVGLCQYESRRFPPGVLLDVLTSHPWVAVGTDVYENFYHLPPAELLGPDVEAATLQQWLKNLTAWKRRGADFATAREGRYE
ncbi:MAG: MEDS domain-containing protein [Acidobacteriia bacterium]|nr:MEDS domain-containing protein [Terriglobia bacterium]